RSGGSSATSGSPAHPEIESASNTAASDFDNITSLGAEGRARLPPLSRGGRSADELSKRGGSERDRPTALRETLAAALALLGREALFVTAGDLVVEPVEAESHREVELAVGVEGAAHRAIRVVERRGDAGVLQAERDVQVGQHVVSDSQ